MKKVNEFVGDLYFAAIIGACIVISVVYPIVKGIRNALGNKR